MDFILKDGKGKSFWFPVNPEEVNISRDKGMETVTLLSSGEFDLPQGEKVKEISFSSFFPQQYDEGYCRYMNIPDPMEAMNQLNLFLLSKTPLRFMITGTGVNVPVWVTSHKTTLRGGETGDVYFDLTLRTWRELKVGKIAAASKGGSSGTAARNRADLKTSPKTYTVKSGDSLSKIAKLELGSSARWNEIYKLNKTVIGKDPNRIKPGQKLVMP